MLPISLYRAAEGRILLNDAPNGAIDAIKIRVRIKGL